jgi:hypothetical protein
VNQPAAEFTTDSGQPEAEPSINDIAGLLDLSENEESTQDDSRGETEGDENTTTDDEGGDDGASDDDGGKDDEKAAKDDDESWKTRKVKVSIQGEEHEITLHEATQGYMREQDYRRKTSEAAELTRTAQAERQQVHSELAQRVNALDTLSAALYRELVGDQSQLAGLIESDPQEYLRAQARMQGKVQLLNQAEAQRQAMQQQAINEGAKAQAESLKQAETRLLDMLPEWKDSTKRTAETRDIASTLRDAGYSDDELAGLSDPRAVVIARDAALWRRHQALQAKKAPAAPPTPPTPVKPGTSGNANTTAAAKKAGENFRRNPESLDALSSLAHERGI